MGRTGRGEGTIWHRSDGRRQMLGHSQISLTMNTYSHALPALQREAAARLQALLGTDH